MNSPKIKALCDQAVALYQARRPAEALAKFDKAVSLQPSYADAWNDRGVVLIYLKRLDEALASLDIGLREIFITLWTKLATFRIPPPSLLIWTL